ncbi:n-terminal acetyltransferase c complex catalytic subunit mak3, partial [Coemansia nantahalensis]
QTAARPLVDARFQESVAGAVTIRAFEAGHHAQRELMRALASHARFQWMGDSIETWIDITMTLLRESAIAAAFAIALASAASPTAAVTAVVGARASPVLLSLVHRSVMMHLGRLQHLIRHSHPLRASLASAARYLAATRIDREDSGLADAAAPAVSWPARGGIVFDSVSAHYANAPAVLREVSFSIAHGQHVGIVGRTGSGKTSIAMALLGLLRPHRGRIVVDGVDIAHVASAVLCQRLAVVPQAAYVLPGSLRENLDPHARHSDQALRTALVQVGLPDTNLACTQVATWSMGQRQLLALARVLLSDSPIVVLDEATASIDAATSRHLHAVVRTQLAHRTVITIAHQIDAVRACDIVLVVHDGAEYQSFYLAKSYDSNSGVAFEDWGITFTTYKAESDLEPAIKLIDQDLSEPYSIYTYRYFVHQWPELCILAHTESGECAGVIICKLEAHKRRYYEGHFADGPSLNRGYIAMIAVGKPFRKLGIGRSLVRQALDRMKAMGADEVAMEAETTNSAALALYQRLGFVKDKRLYRYYMDGTDAFRLKLWLS